MLMLSYWRGKNCFGVGRADVVALQQSVDKNLPVKGELLFDNVEQPPLRSEVVAHNVNFIACCVRILRSDRRRRSQWLCSDRLDCGRHGPHRRARPRQLGQPSGRVEFQTAQNQAIARPSTHAAATAPALLCSEPPIGRVRILTGNTLGISRPMRDAGRDRRATAAVPCRLGP